jgi:hypothetical protein
VTDASFAKMATVSASTKRKPAAVDGKSSGPVTYLTGLLITPLMPVTPEIVQMYRLHSPRDSYRAYIEGNPDIVEGDILVIGGTEYQIPGVADWTGFSELIVQKVKGT